MAGPGESMYTRYDRDIAARAQIWLHEKAREHRGDRPWVLFVSFVAPHFPLTAPSEHFYRYYEDDALPWPKLYAPGERPTRPFVTDYASSLLYDKYFENEDLVRRGVAGYHGLCTFLDEQIGKGAGRTRRHRSGRFDDGDLHERSRRQPGQPGIVGQVHDVRGGRRGATRHRGGGNPRRPRDRHPHEPRRRVPVHPRMRRGAGREDVHLLAANGGREAVIARGDPGFSVPPGVTPMFG